MRGTERTCRARGNYSHLQKCFWCKGQPEQRCGSGFERPDILASGECRYRDREYRDPVTRPSWLQSIYLRGFTTHGSATLLDTKGGQVGDPCWQPMLRNFLLNPDDITQEDMVLLCSSTIANHCDRLHELMALAMRAGADVACLQGTLFDGVGEWTN